MPKGVYKRHKRSARIENDQYEPGSENSPEAEEIEFRRKKLMREFSKALASMSEIDRLRLENTVLRAIVDSRGEV